MTGATGNLPLPRGLLTPFLLALAFDSSDATVSGTFYGSLGAAPLAGRHSASIAAANPFAGTFNLGLPAPSPTGSYQPGAGGLRAVLTTTGTADGHREARRRHGRLLCHVAAR